MVLYFTLLYREFELHFKRNVLCLFAQGKGHLDDLVVHGMIMLKC